MNINMNQQSIIDELLYQWNAAVNKISELFDEMAPWAFEQEVAPDRNKMSYLIGHLVVSQDKILEAMQLGDRFYKDLDELYTSPQDSLATYLPYEQLREKWLHINSVLEAKFKLMTYEDWFEKHYYVSSQDFSKQPHRNRMAIFLSRYNHLFTHAGQLRLIKKAIAV